MEIGPEKYYQAIFVSRLDRAMTIIKHWKSLLASQIPACSANNERVVPETHGGALVRMRSRIRAAAVWWTRRTRIER